MFYVASPLSRLLRDPMGAMGLILVASFLAMAVAAPLLAPYDPVALNVVDKFQPPSLAHWAGTDQLGRDLLSRIIYGARTALGIAVTSVGIAGYGPRWVDAVLVLAFDSMSSLPMIMFALAVITVLV